jgi:hypothetical protein
VSHLQKVAPYLNRTEIGAYYHARQPYSLELREYVLILSSYALVSPSATTTRASSVKLEMIKTCLLTFVGLHLLSLKKMEDNLHGRLLQ